MKDRLKSVLDVIKYKAAHLPGKLIGSIIGLGMGPFVGAKFGAENFAEKHETETFGEAYKAHPVSGTCTIAKSLLVGTISGPIGGAHAGGEVGIHGITKVPKILQDRTSVMGARYEEGWEPIFTAEDTQRIKLSQQAAEAMQRNRIFEPAKLEQEINQLKKDCEPRSFRTGHRATH